MEEISKSTILQALTLNQVTVDGKKDSWNDVCHCIFCEHTEKNEGNNILILKHLYFCHHLVISDVELIVDLQKYLAYWKEQFKDQPKEEYCTTMHWRQKPDGTVTEENVKYFLLSDIVPKDKIIRESLQTTKIENALARHQFERSDKNFLRGCLYCRSTIDPMRYNYIEHLYSKHFLHLGKPENLVYIDDLIDLIEEKLSNLICIYCEKVFKDRATLKEHMRKKGHKKINPDNKTYDRFFMINYKIKDNLSSAITTKSFGPRKNDQQVEPEVFENDDSEWSEWNEQDKEIQTTCLFCSLKENDFNRLLKHVSQFHNFDFEKVTEKFNFYQKVKLVNYIRRKIHLRQCLSCEESFENLDMMLSHLNEQNHLHCDVKIFDKPEFFFPTFEDDNFLCYLDNFNENDENCDDSFGAVISEEKVLSVNEDAEMLSREKFIDI